MKKNNKKAFTIVELVIVIGVIGILSAILIPTFTNLTNSAREAATKEEIQNVYTAYVMDGSDDTPFDLIAKEDLAFEKKTDTGKYYVYDSEKNAWNPTAITGTPAGAKQGDTTNGYNGYFVYKLTASA